MALFSEFETRQEGDFPEQTRKEDVNGHVLTLQRVSYEGITDRGDTLIYVDGVDHKTDKTVHIGFSQSWIVQPLLAAVAAGKMGGPDSPEDSGADYEGVLAGLIQFSTKAGRTGWKLTGEGLDLTRGEVMTGMDAALVAAK